MMHKKRVMHDEATYFCGACGEEIVIPLDLTAGASQEYVEDCPVCCAPMEVFVKSKPGEIISISVTAD